ncbi:hypothetical protein Tco_0959746 [Tanacetum coccineum]
MFDIVLNTGRIYGQSNITSEERDKPKKFTHNSKIVEVIKTSYELGHKHMFITEIMVRIANGKINPITESDYKHLNKNDIEDLYMLKKLLTITSKPVVGLIYENNKKENRVMILKENPKFCYATLKRILEMVKKYNKDIK